MSDGPIPETDVAEAKLRAEWLHKHKAHKDWIILSVSEVTVIRDELLILERERDEAREQIDNIRKMLSESGEAVGNGVHNYSIIEMIQNLVKSKSYFMQKSYAEFFKPTVDEEGAK